MAFSKRHIPWNKGKALSKETREKVRQSVLKLYKDNPELPKLISVLTREAMQNPKVKQKMSEELKKLWADEKWRTNWSKTASLNRSGIKHWNWKGGISEYVGFHKARTKIRQQNQSCSLCGIKKISKKMCVHHIDGDKSNQNLDNLQVLCKSCHCKLHGVG